MVDASYVLALYWYTSKTASRSAVATLFASARISPPESRQESQRKSLSSSLNPDINLVLHPTPPLHLRMELQRPARALALVNILPINLAIPALQNRPVNSRAGLAERHGPPLAVLDSSQFHSATHGLGDSELAAQEGHFQVVLLLLPG